MMNKFIKRVYMLAFLSTAIMLLLVLGGINIANYSISISRTNDYMDKYLEDNYKSDRNSGPFRHGPSRPTSLLSFDESGNIVFKSDNFKFESTNIENIAQKIYEKSKNQVDSQGAQGIYRYIVRHDGNITNIVLTDYRFDKEGISTMFFTSIIIFLVSEVLVMFLVYMFQKPLLKPVVESYDKQKRFITDAGHELKTPITVISASNDLIKMESGKSEWTDTIEEEVSKLMKLINAFILLAKMDETDNIKKEEVDMSRLLMEVIEGMSPAFEVVNKEMKFNVNSGIKILGNKTDIEKLISILLENSLKYSKKEGMTEINLYKEKNKAVLNIKNQVDKIEKKNHDEYFERFYRPEKSRNSQLGGSGIGLSIAKSITENHKGTIKAYSKDEDTFEIVVRM